MECPVDEAQSATGLSVDLGDVVFPRELGVDDDSKVVVVVKSRDVLSIHGICVDGGLPLRGNREYRPFVDTKIHLRPLGPLNESVQVIFVQDGMVIWCEYLPVYYAVISEESCHGVYIFHAFRCH